MKFRALLPHKASFYSVVLCSAFALYFQPSWAENEHTRDYSFSGKVISSSAEGMHSYQVATDSKVYQLMCARSKGIHFGLPECKIDGQPIVAGNAFQFRVDGDWVYLPDGKGSEVSLLILSVEFKTPPSVSSNIAAEGSQDTSSNTRGIVIGEGMHILGQSGFGWSNSHAGMPSASIASPGISSPVIATAPVMATPVTGGAPVMMVPSAPVSGGIVTGTPVTGGAPVVGVAASPVIGVPMSGPPAVATAPSGVAGMPQGPRWVHFLSIQNGKTISTYDCYAKSCEVQGKQIELGDALNIRTDKKWAYATSTTGSGEKELRLRIVNEAEANAAQDSK